MQTYHDLIRDNTYILPTLCMMLFLVIITIPMLLAPLESMWNISNFQLFLIMIIVIMKYLLHLWYWMDQTCKRFSSCIKYDCKIIKKRENMHFIIIIFTIILSTKHVTLYWQSFCHINWRVNCELCAKNF